ncbi:MAG: carboxymuconolactone decarboxylase family protein [Phycisphaerales bacterium]|nr:carboxymuconolactone decarboxylase family protein [Phycisphaerales bacterium]
MATQRKPKVRDLPPTFRTFIRAFPELADTHERVAKVVDDAGPLDRKTCELIKIGICLGGGLESALRSHARRARELGASESEIEQAVLLGMTTCGFPRTVAAWQWTRKPSKRGR